MKTLSEIIVWLSVACGFGAAVLWYLASKIIVRIGDPRSKGGFFTGVKGEPDGKQVDVYSTVIEGSKMNQLAALATGATVLLQALGALLAKFSN